MTLTKRELFWLAWLGLAWLGLLGLAWLGWLGLARLAGWAWLDGLAGLAGLAGWLAPEAGGTRWPWLGEPGCPFRFAVSLR